MVIPSCKNEFGIPFSNFIHSLNFLELAKTPRPPKSSPFAPFFQWSWHLLSGYHHFHQNLSLDSRAFPTNQHTIHQWVVAKIMANGMILDFLFSIQSRTSIQLLLAFLSLTWSLILFTLLHSFSHLEHSRPHLQNAFFVKVEGTVAKK